ncbi:MAG: DUF2203 domain-containing protein [Acidobacteriia bacterium]|jgi:hypothetical protein|nr:DUF2203 domain-containing protein [Terriglobia bacterium]
MGDEEREFSKLFSLKEAERVRAQVEPVLIEAMELRRHMQEVAGQLAEIVSRIQLLGGTLIPLERAASLRHEHNRIAEQLRKKLEQIHATGCLVKDLEMGLLDFPSVLNNEEVFLCWRLGEDRIRFWHRLDEGYAGRKPLEPSAPGSTGPEPPVN